MTSNRTPALKWTAVALIAIVPALSGCLSFGRDDRRYERDRAERTPAIWPVNHPKMAVTSQFGPRWSASSRQTRNHNGIDIAAPKGTRVRAAAKGVVSFSGEMRGYGKLVCIDHGYGVETWYAHLNRRKVKRGRRVDRGDIIGRVGSTGNASAPHLHYEVRINGEPVDPMPFLAPGRTLVTEAQHP
jgi:murein DD-endopeptidase MepM/ murein hydrolase activator NlpD